MFNHRDKSFGAIFRQDVFVQVIDFRFDIAIPIVLLTLDVSRFQNEMKK
jgi:hypothetical protein